MHQRRIPCSSCFEYFCSKDSSQRTCSQECLESLSRRESQQKEIIQTVSQREAIENQSWIAFKKEKQKRIGLFLKSRKKKRKKKNRQKLIIEQQNEIQALRSKISRLEKIAPKENNKPISFYETREWRTLRYRVLKNQGRICCLCRRTDGIMHVDHIKPRSKYPELSLVESNLQVLCESCNLGKSNLDETDWRKK